MSLALATWMPFDHGLVYHLPRSASVPFPHQGRGLGEVGRVPRGNWDERNVSWTLQESSCHNTKDTNTPSLGRMEGCKFCRGKRWHAAWICHIFHDLALNAQSTTTLDACLQQQWPHLLQGPKVKSKHRKFGIGLSTFIKYGMKGYRVYSIKCEWGS